MNVHIEHKLVHTDSCGIVLEERPLIHNLVKEFRVGVLVIVLGHNDKIHYELTEKQIFESITQGRIVGEDENTVTRSVTIGTFSNGDKLLFQQTRIK